LDLKSYLPVVFLKRRGESVVLSLLTKPAIGMTDFAGPSMAGESLNIRVEYVFLNTGVVTMLMQQITDEMKQAMKAGDKLKLGAIRMLRAALKDKEIELGNALSEEDVIAVVGRMIKQRKDSANQYAEAGRDDLAAKELEETHVFEAYMPAQLSEDEVTAIVAEAVTSSGAEGMRDMGKVMGVIRPKLQGKADMGMVSALVKQQLQG
jgi:uncharacterized protein